MKRLLALTMLMAMPALADWPKSASDPEKPAAACKRRNGEGVVPCCWDVKGQGECGWERAPAPAVPKVPIEPGGTTSGVRR